MLVNIVRLKSGKRSPEGHRWAGTGFGELLLSVNLSLPILLELA